MAWRTYMNDVMNDVMVHVVLVHVHNLHVCVYYMCYSLPVSHIDSDGVVLVGEATRRGGCPVKTPPTANRERGKELQESRVLPRHRNMLLTLSYIR